MKILIGLIIITIFKNVYTQFNDNYERTVINNINYFNNVQNINRNREFVENQNPFEQNQFSVFNSGQHNQETINYPALHYSGNHKPFIIPELKENQNFRNQRNFNTNPAQFVAASPQGRSLGRSSSSSSSSSFSANQYSNNEAPMIGNRFGVEDNNDKPAETFQYQYSKGWSPNEAVNVDNLVLPHLEDHKYLKYSTPNRPGDQYYQQFYNIYNSVENQGKQDLTQYEMDSINDDFNGRSIVAPGQYPHMVNNNIYLFVFI